MYVYVRVRVRGFACALAGACMQLMAKLGGGGGGKKKVKKKEQRIKRGPRIETKVITQVEEVIVTKEEIVQVSE